MRRLFISDLHLGDHNLHLSKLFHAFMEHFVESDDALFILGDFFEVWIGDDDIDAIADSVITALAAHPGPKYLLHGNRDFLIGSDFANKAGTEIITEPYPISLAGKQCILLHGDSLCTDDVEYQQFKAMVRNPEWQKKFLARPIAERQAIAQGMREKSKESTQMKAEEITDVSPTAVANLFKTSKAEIMIHGHTHRQFHHQLKITGLKKERIVLGDWAETMSVLIVDEQDMKLHNFRLEELT